jgi:hypothetical protein
MRFVDPPSLDSPERGLSGDDLDGLLSAFFRAELPDPWPAVTVLAPAVVPLPAAAPPRRRNASRLALAASVALFLTGSWLVSGKLPDAPPDSGPLPHHGSANRLHGTHQSSVELTHDGKTGQTGVRIDVRPVPKKSPMADQLNDMLP